MSARLPEGKRILITGATSGVPERRREDANGS